MIEILLPLVVFILVGIGARGQEEKHYANIRQREILTMDLPVLNEKLDTHNSYIRKTKFVSASIAISDDLFKYVWAMLKATFGGSLTPYELVLDRARREAILRLKESCIDADAIANIHFCHSSIGRRMVELVVYGTAIYWHEDTKIKRNAD